MAENDEALLVFALLSLFFSKNRFFIENFRKTGDFCHLSMNEDLFSLHPRIFEEWHIVPCRPYFPYIGTRQNEKRNTVIRIDKQIFLHSIYTGTCIGIFSTPYNKKIPIGF